MSDTNNTQSPIVKVAAVAVIVFAIAGIGVMTGIIPTAMSAKETAKACTDCGVIESVRLVEQKGQGSGAGAVTGGIVGAVVGNQIGQGRGKDLATVAGAAGGAYAGNEIEKNMKKTTHLQITVRMNDGGTRTFTRSHDAGFKSGDNVRVVNGNLIKA